MRALILVLLFVGAQCASVSHHGHDNYVEHHRDDDDHHDNPDQVGISQRIEDLTAAIVNFESDIDSENEQQNSIEDETTILTVNVDTMEGSGCDDRFQMQCGGKKPQCLTRLMICDGYVDCSSGNDEDQCDVLVPAGSVWQGTMTTDGCTSRGARSFTLTIDEYQVIDHIKAFPQVKATMDIEFENDELDLAASIPMSGWMDLKPGNHILYFESPENDNLAVSCLFDGVSADHCHGHFLRESSQTNCADFFLQRDN